MITGQYRILSNGIELARADNVITTLGKRSILRYLAGLDSSFAGAIGVGCSASIPNSPSVDDIHLGFEFARAPVTVTSVDYSNQDVIFKATLPTGQAGKVYEMGLFTYLDNKEAGAFSSKLLSSCGSSELWTATPSALAYDTTNYRVGPEALLADITTSSGTQTFTSSVRFNLAGYSYTDEFGLAFVTYYNYIENIQVKFTNSSGTTMVGTFTPASHTAGTNVAQMQLVKLSKLSFTNSSSDWSEIVTLQILVTAKSSASATNRGKVAVDGLRVYDNDTISSQYSLVSRAAVTPVTKVASTPLDLEYRLRFSL